MEIEIPHRKELFATSMRKIRLPWKRLMTMSGESVRIAPESLWQNAEKKFLVMKKVSSLGKQDIGMMTCGVVSWTIWRH